MQYLNYNLVIFFDAINAGPRGHKGGQSMQRKKPILLGDKGCVFFL